MNHSTDLVPTDSTRCHPGRILKHRPRAQDYQGRVEIQLLTERTRVQSLDHPDALTARIYLEYWSQQRD